MIIFIYGKDTYSSQLYLDGIVKKFKTEVDPSGINYSRIDGSQVTTEALSQEVFASGFMVPKRLIVIKHILENKKEEVKKFIEKIIEQDAHNENIIVLYETTPSKQLKSFKVLSKTAYAKEFPEITSQDLPAYIKQEAQRLQIVLDQGLITLLAQKLSPDTWQIHQELLKLKALSESTKLTKEVLEEVIEPHTPDTVFALIDALATRNKKKALQQLEDQLSRGAHELGLLALISRQCKLMLQIQSLMQSRGNVSDQEVASILRLHPYVAKKTKAQAMSFDLPYLKKMYTYLLHLDKSFKQSAGDPKTLLETFIVKL